jgi:pheromone a factor receptor
MHRLRKHRGALSSTLSSTGSGFNSRRFVKLFFLSASILVVYLPITLYFLYINVDYPYTTYSWSRVHNPATWDPILFVTTATVPRVQYWGWIGIVMAGIVVFLYGMSREAAEIYKGWLIKCGLSKIFPGLLRPREFPTNRRGSSSRGSWIARFDLVTRVMHYCDGVRKGSQAPEWDT